MRGWEIWGKFKESHGRREKKREGKETERKRGFQCEREFGNKKREIERRESEERRLILR